MTVAELIELLSALPKQTRVFAVDELSESIYAPKIRTIIVQKEPSEWTIEGHPRQKDGEKCVVIDYDEPLEPFGSMK